MRQDIENRWLALWVSGRASASVLECWAWHEWHGLQGHRVELVERLQFARKAQSLAELIRDQLDLLPESRRRLQRNATTRREILAELGSTLRQTVQSQR